MKGRDRRQRHHRVQGGQKPSHPALVELGEGKPAVCHFRLDDPGDQVAGDDEEDIDADKTAIHGRRLEMERDHREYRDGAQPVDIFTIVAPHNRYAAQTWLKQA